MRMFAKSEGRVITLFVGGWNARQMLRQLYPKCWRVSLYHFDWNTPPLLMRTAGTNNGDPSPQ